MHLTPVCSIFYKVFLFFFHIYLVDKQNVYGLGARKIGVTSLPPLGCIPLARTLFGYHEKGCVSRFNTDAQQFNKKLNAAATNLQKQYPDLKMVVFDIYKALLDVVNTPSNYGKGRVFPCVSLVGEKRDFFNGEENRYYVITANDYVLIW